MRRRVAVPLLLGHLVRLPGIGVADGNVEQLGGVWKEVSTFEAFLV